MNAVAADITRLLIAWREGDRGALDALTPLMYEELRRLAERYMRREAPSHTLQATALLHEAYARVAEVELPWRDRAHFRAFMARTMRRILVDYARARNASKRGADLSRVSLDESAVLSPDSDALVLELNDVLEELRQFDERKSRIIELRYFGGLSSEEIATALDISTSTLDRELRLAKAWLRHRMGPT
jgi:RNA polymerase sigma factor (TIGR02999 family)